MEQSGNVRMGFQSQWPHHVHRAETNARNAGLRQWCSSQFLSQDPCLTESFRKAVSGYMLSLGKTNQACHVSSCGVFSISGISNHCPKGVNSTTCREKMSTSHHEASPAAYPDPTA
ncbi:hypothetical protein VFPPC_17633 [Pochonia chlamydosporia 170]|uniref:Uncharacterized protein n=1 Tax=Pochonia chlamydosporia 170 TaxID=1380566 RepID=A0A219AR07_METCM|nr:hypothetical protein VFPPC_17633 [Pochonia chlamydosporia 170]OWT43191.1 hypothetical protein VFPPC_17633 [Pochonia chlamydosporia 170]